MPAPVIVTDRRNSTSLRVAKEGAGIVSQTPYPPTDLDTKLIPFTAYITVNGDGTTSDLRVDGSVNPVEAYIKASDEGDLYLTEANILIAGSGVSLNRFAGLTALTNGIDVFYDTDAERRFLAKGLKTNFSFIRLATLTSPIGDKTNAFQISNAVAGTNDGYNPRIDLTRLSPVGLLIKKGSTNKLGIIINDNLTSIGGAFDILIIGFIRLP